jgi:hypothetical protein
VNNKRDWRRRRGGVCVGRGGGGGKGRGAEGRGGRKERRRMRWSIRGGMRSGKRRRSGWLMGFQLKGEERDRRADDK